MDGNDISPADATREWLVARSATLHERVQRVRRKRRPPDEPAPRDSSDAAILRENDGILRSIEESARRELAQIERALERLARLDTGRGGI